MELNKQSTSRHKENVQTPAHANDDGDDDEHFPEDIRQLLENAAAAKFSSVESRKEYEEVFEETKLILTEAQSVERTTSFDMFIAESRVSGAETDMTIEHNQVRIDRLKEVVRDQNKKHDDLLNENKNIDNILRAGACPSNWFTKLKLKWKLIGVGTFILIIVIVAVVVLYLTLILPKI